MWGSRVQHSLFYCAFAVASTATETTAMGKKRKSSAQRSGKDGKDGDAGADDENRDTGEVDLERTVTQAQREEQAEKAAAVAAVHVRALAESAQYLHIHWLAIQPHCKLHSFIPNTETLSKAKIS